MCAEVVGGGSGARRRTSEGDDGGGTVAPALVGVTQQGQRGSADRGRLTGRARPMEPDVDDEDRSLPSVTRTRAADVVDLRTQGPGPS